MAKHKPRKEPKHAPFGTEYFEETKGAFDTNWVADMYRDCSSKYGNGELFIDGLDLSQLEALRNRLKNTIQINSNLVSVLKEYRYLDECGFWGFDDCYQSVSEQIANARRHIAKIKVEVRMINERIWMIKNQNAKEIAVA